MTTTNIKKATLSNHLTLDNEKMKALFGRMDDLLADYHVFYQNVRGFHWNIRGNSFFTLHEKFEELYTQLYKNIDELAERIVTIGYRPMHAYSDYLKSSIQSEITEVSSEEACVRHVIDGLGTVISVHRKAIEAAAEAEDKVSEDMLIKFVGDLEKRMWMFTMYKK